MIKSIEVINHLGESVFMELTDPDATGFAIKSINGLGPVKASINFTELATNDGAIDNSARLDSRNITLSLAFLPHPTIEDTRLLSYRYFPIKRNVTFKVKTDKRYCQTTGRIESNEPTIFSSEEGCQISIMCPDPYFYSTANFRTMFYGIDPLFEFPFSNESLTEPLLEMGSIEKRTERAIYYDGDMEVGITIRIHAIGEVEGLTIYSTERREIMKIDDEKLITLMGSGIQAGDDITIVTSRGEKSITMLRNGVATNILNVLQRPINWFQLSKGINMFVYTASVGLSNLQFSIENKIVYGGV